MKAKPMAAWHAALFNTILLVLVISFPAIAQAKSQVVNGFEKSKLVTTEDFIHYPWQRIDDSDYRVPAQPVMPLS